jgi:hypothetical protein
MATGRDWSERVVELADVKLHLARAGSGRPVLVLHHDIGSPDQLEFYDALAGRFDVLVPHHPGYGKACATSRSSTKGCCPISGSSEPR